MRCPSAIAMACLALAAAGPVSSPAEAKTFVLPHVLETSGEAGVTEYTFDTRLSLSPVPGSGATGPARVDLYLYDTLGLPLPAGPGVGRCDPCTLWVDTGVPETVMTVESLLRAGGNFPTMPGPWLGVVVADDALDVQAFTVNRHGLFRRDLGRFVRTRCHMRSGGCPCRLFSRWLLGQLVVQQAQHARLHQLAQHGLGQRDGRVVVVDVGVQPIHHVVVRVGEQLLHRRILDLLVDVARDEAREIGFGRQRLHVFQGGLR